MKYPGNLLLLAVMSLMAWRPVVLRAQSLEGTITAQDAWQYAEANSPALGRLRARLAAEQGRRLSAYGINNPQLNYAREAIPNGEGGFGEQRWVIQQSLDFPLQTIFRLKQYDAGRQAVEAEIDAERMRLREQVKIAYVTLMHAEALLDWRRRAVQLGDTLLQTIGARIVAGEAAELDRMRAQLDQAGARTDLEEAERMRQAACADLHQTVGLELPVDGCSIITADSLRAFEASLTRDAVVQPAAWYPEMQQATASLSAARFNIQRNRGAYLPQLHVNYWPQDFGNGYDFHGFEVGFTLPVWFIFNQRSATRVAQAEAQQREWDVQDVSVRLQTEREKAWTGFTVSRQALDRFEQDVNVQADSTLMLTRRAYELGEIDLLPLLDTRRVYIDVRIRYLEALKAYYRDLIRLERFAGEELVFE